MRPTQIPSTLFQTSMRGQFSCLLMHSFNNMVNRSMFSVQANRPFSVKEKETILSSQFSQVSEETFLTVVFAHASVMKND